MVEATKAVFFFFFSNLFLIRLGVERYAFSSTLKRKPVLYEPIAILLRNSWRGT